ncbi:MAG TPA: hypothetical protein HA359_06345 [Candidatus Poseidoniaceae archaeon]|nr:MAG TPA: hypothetical protein D7H84_06335 [Candidatus Poseidoniales archaeon]HII23857.1 hypothetical protein [Candidatus Poseidoniaceae archaeon]
MTDWELVDISDDKPESFIEDLENLDYGGLESDVQNLHTNFWKDADHLTEVEDRHLQVLVSSGMIPEDHIASTEPSRKLDWFVKELNGRLNPDGLSIPLKGLEIEDIEIYQKTSENESVIKLNLTEKDGQELERIMNIPNDSPEFNIQANFYNNRLYLRW